MPSLSTNRDFQTQLRSGRTFNLVLYDYDIGEQTKDKEFQIKERESLQRSIELQ